MERSAGLDGDGLGAAAAVGPAPIVGDGDATAARSEEHTSELQSPCNLVCRLLLEKKKIELLPFLLSCLIWLDLVESVPLLQESLFVLFLLLRFLSLIFGSVLVLCLRRLE